MADKKNEGKFHANIDEIENGYEVSCRRDRKQSLSQRAGWVPSSYEEPKKVFCKTMKDVVKHLEEN
jgi:hypothetical protein